MTQGESNPLLTASDVTVAYHLPAKTINAVTGAHLTIQHGEFVGLVGGTAAGKSTLALALLGLVRSPGRILRGSVVFQGADLLKLSDRDLRRVRGAQIGLVTQNPRSSLNPMLQIGRQIVDAYRAHAQVGKAEATERGIEMLRLVGINDPDRRFYAYPHELSGGMAQRAVIAIALTCRPQLLIADEPTSGLDVTVRAQILDDFNKSVELTGSAVLLITQDLAVIANYCRRVVVMHEGKIVEDAPVRQFFRQPAHSASKTLLATQIKATEQIRLRYSSGSV
jgi:ABC-type dipeptide/oligopeptide/nickel transport system ATPase component